MALTVIHRDEVKLNAAWGWLDPATQQRATQTDSLFDLASVSKLFTVTAFLAQVSEGLVALDDPLVSVIPEFGESGSRPLDGGQDPHTREMMPYPDELRDQRVDPTRVTLRQLLTHTSGLAPWRDIYMTVGMTVGNPPPPPDQPDPLARSARWQRALSVINHYPFVGHPGDGVVRYSDLGLILLGDVITRLDGRPSELDVVLSGRLFQPLALSSLTYNPLQHDRWRNTIAPTENDPLWRRRRCWGEVHDENANGMGGVAGHAGLFGTARDVAAFGHAWMVADRRLGVSRELMRAAVCQQARTDTIRRGLGWMLKSETDSPAGSVFSAASYGHTGFTGTSLWIDPHRELVVACLTNRVYGGRMPSRIQTFRQALHDLIARECDRL